MHVDMFLHGPAAIFRAGHLHGTAYVRGGMPRGIATGITFAECGTSGTVTIAGGLSSVVHCETGSFCLGSRPGGIEPEVYCYADSI